MLVGLYNKLLTNLPVTVGNIGCSFMYSLDKNPQEMIAKVNELQKKLENMREHVEKLPGIDLSKEEQRRQMEVLRQQLITKTELLKKYKSTDMFEVR